MGAGDVDCSEHNPGHIGSSLSKRLNAIEPFFFTESATLAHLTKILI